MSQRQRPFEGIRVLDLTAWWSGPAATMLLGALGADVIKIESIQHPDLWRMQVADPRAMVGDWWENGSMWNALNMNKRDVTLDLAKPGARELFLKLTARSDVVIENYSPRVMANFGLDFDTLAGINPRLVMLSMSCFGATGPWRDFVGFALVFEQMAGVAELTGHPDLPPSVIGGAADPFASLYAVFAVLMALEAREKTGKGQHIDLSQTETMTQAVGAEVIDYQFNSRLGRRRGSQDPQLSPHGCYPCLGEDQWVAIAVTDDAEWRSLVEAMGSPSWTEDPDLAEAAGRRRRRDELDRRIGEWTSGQDKLEVMGHLQERGVPAGAMYRAADLASDPQLEARGFHREVTREGLGTFRFPQWALRFSDFPCEIARASPRLGEHNREVLGGLLGLTDSDLQRLEADGVIGTRPVGL